MDYIPNKKQKILIVFDDILADMLSIKKLNPIAIDLFVITQFYFIAQKNIRLDSTDYFVMKIWNKRESQEIAFNDSRDIEFEDFYQSL